MFLRFSTPELHRHSQQELGVFQAVFNLRDGGALTEHEESHLQQIREWFNANLDIPTRFTNAKPPYYRKRQNGISWFKASARDHVKKIWELVAILDNHGVRTTMIKTARPGYIVYEDEFQVVAIPFADSDI